MNENGNQMNVVSWVAIIISIVIASVGMLIGSIRTSSANANATTQTKLEVQNVRITALEIQYGRIDEKLSNIENLLEKHIGK
jgi:flagellar basal body-associated protein FliL